MREKKRMLRRAGGKRAVPAEHSVNIREKGNQMGHREKTQLYDFYNERLRNVGIGEEVQGVSELSELQRLSAALSGVGLPMLSFWLLGRNRMRA